LLKKSFGEEREEGRVKEDDYFLVEYAFVLISNKDS
jgi:hypothetical protein